MERGPVRLAELLTALAAATDLGMGQPAGHAVQTALLSVRLARTFGLSSGAVADVLYTALLRYVGCTADAPEVAFAAGDEIVLAAAVGPYVMGDVQDRVVHTAVADPERAMAASMAVHCEAAGLLGSRLGLGRAVTESLRHGFERWDGGGHPAGLAEDQIPLPVRIVVLARDVVLWQRLGGPIAARAMAVQRRGHAYDPDIVDAYLNLEDRGEQPGGRGSVWEQLAAAEPHPRTVAPADVDALLTVFADFADLKMPSALGHSRRVAEAAAAAGQDLELDVEQVGALRRAGLVHDLGRAGVSSSIWTKTEPLSEDDWERIRLHPYLTERILRRSPPLADLAVLAGSHHERLDGSGYHRGLSGIGLGRSERVLAAADAYVSLREARPHRPALEAADVVARLRVDVETGRLDALAVRAVVAAAGEELPPPASWPAGLSDREVDVLQLAVRGLTIRQVATRLGIAPKTVDRHLQNSYAKIGVSSRAAAALFVVHHGLLH